MNNTILLISDETNPFRRLINRVRRFATHDVKPSEVMDQLYAREFDLLICDMRDEDAALALMEQIAPYHAARRLMLVENTQAKKATAAYESGVVHRLLPVDPHPRVLKAAVAYQLDQCGSLGLPSRFRLAS